MSDRLFCFYGDDFTGSTDALEALAANGVPTVLFLDSPDQSRLARFPHCCAIGIAGESRSRDPKWMSRELPDIFENLKHYKAPLCQYKVCSTFDSSPDFGSIGRAIEIGQQVFGCPYTPVVIGAPHLKRYLLFGNLFAAGGAEIHRIDRHPTMSHHPVTPMFESDLRVHLSHQTNRTTGLVDILALHNGNAERRFEELRTDGTQAIFFDGLDERSLQETGRILWTRSQVPHLFAIGSSGLTHAMIHYWRAAGLIEAEHRVEFAQPVDRLIVISGSCSPVTAEQIHWALNHGFEGIRITMPALAEARSRAQILQRALSTLEKGSSIVLYTALGPQDCGDSSAGMDLGTALGVLLNEVLPRSAVRRVAFAGGDTSTHAVRRLGIDALTFAAPLTPGAPLCTAHSANTSADGLGLVLKGGQVGAPDFFGAVLRGSR